MSGDVGKIQIKISQQLLDEYTLNFGQAPPYLNIYWKDWYKYLLETFIVPRCWTTVRVEAWVFKQPSAMDDNVSPFQIEISQQLLDEYP